MPPFTTAISTIFPPLQLYSYHAPAAVARVCRSGLPLASLQARTRGSRWRCAAERDKAPAPSPGGDETASPDGREVEEEASSSGSGYDASFSGPSKGSNRILALVSCAVAVGLFLAPRITRSGPGLGELASMAVPYDEALANGRPTVVEFYADWCEVCREMAADVYGVEQLYKEKVNFVMLNVDNSKWEQELDEFGVEGIPHFAFLDKQGNEEGNIVGRLPRRFLQENVDALAKGEATVPHSRVVGRFSDADSRQAPALAGPRSHGIP